MQSNRQKQQRSPPICVLPICVTTAVSSLCIHNKFIRRTRGLPRGPHSSLHRDTGSRVLPRPFRLFATARWIMPSLISLAEMTDNDQIRTVRGTYTGKRPPQHIPICSFVSRTTLPTHLVTTALPCNARQGNHLDAECLPPLLHPERNSGRHIRASSPLYRAH